MAVLRCSQCRILVDVSSSSSRRCASCGGPLGDGAAPPTIWDDDDPTERRPIDYAVQLAKRHKR